MYHHVRAVFKKNTKVFRYLAIGAHNNNLLAGCQEVPTIIDYLMLLPTHGQVLMMHVL